MTLKEIGNMCKEYRISKGYTQSDVANNLMYSNENISAFENGRNDNLRIFMWYIEHGLILKGVGNNDNKADS